MYVCVYKHILELFIPVSASWCWNYRLQSKFEASLSCMKPWTGVERKKAPLNSKSTPIKLEEHLNKSLRRNATAEVSIAMIKTTVVVSSDPCDKILKKNKGQFYFAQILAHGQLTPLLSDL